jgi:hypothetical protein
MNSATLTLISTILLLGAPELHLSPLSAPMVSGEHSGTRRVALAAAANEQEAFYLRVVNDESPRVFQALDIDWVGVANVIPTTYRIGGEVPSDALASIGEPVSLGAGAELDLLISLKVPETAAQGTYNGTLHARFDSGKPERCSIQLEVFDFTLPAESSLPVLFGIDREAVARITGQSETLDDWALFYDALAGLRAGFAVWPQRKYPDEIFYDYRDLDLIKEHLAYAVRTAHLPAIEIGGVPGALLAGWPPPVGNAPQDPLQLLLFNLTTSLHQLGWAKPTVLIPDLLPERDDWPAARQAFARVNRADEVVARLLPGPLHPYFERYTDIWALPGSTPPSAMSLLDRGLSTIRYAHPPYLEIDGTPSIQDESRSYTTEPGDAFDGCEYTAWRVETEASDGPAVLEVTFDSPCRLEELAILWPYDGSPSEMKVETALNPDAYAEATVRWSKSNFRSEGESDITLGSFRYPRDCRQLRIHFSPTRGTTVGVAELLMNQDGRTVVNSSIEPVVPWLNLRTAQSPWLDASVRGDAWRILPWFCWQRNFRGLLGPVLTPDRESGRTPLIVAGPNGVFPSRSMLHLLDGLEDYEYLRAYWRAVHDRRITPPEQVRPGWLALPSSVREDTQVHSVLGRLEEDRVQMGRLLSGGTIVTTNFGPG